MRIAWLMIEALPQDWNGVALLRTISDSGLAVRPLKGTNECPKKCACVRVCVQPVYKVRLRVVGETCRSHCSRPDFLCLPSARLDHLIPSVSSLLQMLQHVVNALPPKCAVCGDRSPL